MTISLKSLLFLVTWSAWLIGSLIAPGLVSDAFSIAQFFLFASAATLAFTSTGKLRLLGASFAMGFLSWFLYLMADNAFCDAQLYRGTPSGLRICELTRIVVDDHTFVPRTHEESMQHVLHLQQAEGVIRTALGTALGIAVAVFVSFVQPARPPRSGGDASS